MNFFLRSTGRRLDEAHPIHLPSPTPEPALDPRAARYFEQAARYNAAATELGYLSLEHAVRAGKMPEILRRASLSTTTSSAEAV